MPLTNKFLRYSPEITLEIFTLIWDKLKSTFPDSKIYDWKEGNFDNFKKYEFISIWGLNNGYSAFGINNNPGIGVNKETTVQEILGYDPFVKDDFVLPEKWCIKSQSRDQDYLINEFARSCGGGHWNDEDNHARNNYLNISDGEYHRGSRTLDKDFTKITFDQFKKYVLKDHIETSKETIPEYVECINAVTPNTRVGEIFKCRHSNKCFEFEYNDKSKENFNSWDGWSVSWSAKIPQKYFKPSTKEAFDAQNKPIEKWSVGSYVVFLKDYLQNNGRKKGDISKITKIRKDTIEFEDNIGNNIDGEFSVVTNLKWFATKTEAEEFAKTLKPKKLLSLNNWYQSGNHIVYLYERNRVYGFHHDKWFTSEGFGENDLKYVDSNTVEEKFTNYIKNNYLIGQSFIDLVNKIDFQIKSYDLNFGNKTTQIYIPVEPNDLRGNKTARIFDKGIWAEHSSIKSNKQAVHCTIQEEWDFVLSKFNINNLNSADWNTYKEKSCLSLYLDDYRDGYTSLDHFKVDKVKILSFQEWCDLNGYKMEKEVKFEVGRWYKYNKWYLKYLRHDDKVFVASEYITDDKEYIKFASHFGTNDESKVLVSIKEIQQYLPDNHPDKIKPNKNFQDGDWVFAIGNIREYWQPTIGKINKFSIGDKYDSKVDFYGKNGSHCTIWSNVIRHATPEEINNHLISIGQIPAGEPLNTGIEPNKDGVFKYTTYSGTTHVGRTSTISGSLKMTLSIDDEELPMVSIIKTNTIKQLLNND